MKVYQAKTISEESGLFYMASLITVMALGLTLTVVTVQMNPMIPQISAEAHHHLDR